MSVPLILRGQSTDSGGGGTLESLATHLKSDDSLMFADDYLVASCSLHNLQTALRNAIIDVLGEGGKVSGTKTNEFKKNAMQLLHGTYNLRNYLPPKFIRSCWEKSRDEIGSESQHMKYTEFQQAVLTRWWTVGASACQLDAEWDIWVQNPE